MARPDYFNNKNFYREILMSCLQKEGWSHEESLRRMETTEESLISESFRIEIHPDYLAFFLVRTEKAKEAFERAERASAEFDKLLSGGASLFMDYSEAEREREAFERADGGSSSG